MPSCSADTIEVAFLAGIYCWEATSSSVCVCECTCTDMQKTVLFAEQVQFFYPCWTYVSSVASWFTSALSWSWMTLGFCVDGVINPALCTTSLETQKHEGLHRSGQCSSQDSGTAIKELVTQYFFRNCSH